MSRIARSVKITARPGRGDALEAAMLGVAESLRDFPGCELYVVSRLAAEPDAVWITEQWSDRERADAALEEPGARERIGEVSELVADGGFERTELAPVGGVGCERTQEGWSRLSLDQVEDLAPRFGLGATGEARFAREGLGATGIGLSLQTLRPGVRQGFGHRHRRDEEVYVVLAGSGRMAVDDTVIDVGPRDAIRVAPGSARAFEAGPEGLELLAFGTHHAGDAEMLPGFWPVQ